jgi:hypothetical protein
MKAPAAWWPGVAAPDRAGLEGPRRARPAAAMRFAVGLLAGWLLAALLLVAHDGHLPEYLAGATAGSLPVLGIGALLRQQLAPSRYNRPGLPERYRVADDLHQPLAVVVAVAEAEASTGGQQEPPDGR